MSPPRYRCALTLPLWQLLFGIISAFIMFSTTDVSADEAKRPVVAAAYGTNDRSLYRSQIPQEIAVGRSEYRPPLLSIGHARHSADETESESVASAAENDANTPPNKPFLDLTRPQETVADVDGPGIDQDMLLNFALWMVVILCLCGLTVVGLRMLQKRGLVTAGSTGASTGKAKVVDSLSLGRNRLIQLVEIGGRQVLVASDPTGIQSMVPMADDFEDSLLHASSQLEDAA